jgi:hypothetical protein
VKVTVHEFTINDSVDDPEIYVAQPIYEWQQTEAGRWVMENALIEPYWCRIIDYTLYNLKYRIVADLADHDATYFYLRWK